MKYKHELCMKCWRERGGEYYLKYYKLYELTDNTENKTKLLNSFIKHCEKTRQYNRDVPFNWSVAIVLKDGAYKNYREIIWKTIPEKTIKEEESIHEIDVNNIKHILLQCFGVSKEARSVEIMCGIFDTCGSEKFNVCPYQLERTVLGDINDVGKN